MESIERKTMLYKTGVEYGDYCCNYVLGCSHKCDYCYARGLKKRTGQIKSDLDWERPKIVKNTLEILSQELPKMAAKIKNVTLCFATDPFMFGNLEVQSLSIEVINKINDYGIPCSVLTKGIYPDDILKLKRPEMNFWGVTFVSDNIKYWKCYESGAADPYMRLRELKRLKKKGLKTWISAEPWPTLEMGAISVDNFWEKTSWADHIVFGKGKYKSYYSNHNEYFKKCAIEFKNLAEKNLKSYHIKDGTL